MVVPSHLYDYLDMDYEGDMTDTFLRRRFTGRITVTLIDDKRDCRSTKNNWIMRKRLRFKVFCDIESISIVDAIIIHESSISDNLIELINVHYQSRIFTPVIILWNDDITESSYDSFKLLSSNFHVNWTMTLHTYCELSPLLTMVEEEEVEEEEEEEEEEVEEEGGGGEKDKRKTNILLLATECFLSYNKWEQTKNVSDIYPFPVERASKCEEFREKANSFRILFIRHLPNNYFTYEIAQFAGKNRMVPLFGHQISRWSKDVQHFFQLSHYALFMRDTSDDMISEWESSRYESMWERDCTKPSLASNSMQRDDGTSRKLASVISSTSYRLCQYSIYFIFLIRTLLTLSHEFNDICHSFNIGNKLTQHFSTPNHPKNYPSKLKCIRTLQAHHANQIIRVEFDPNKYYIEQSENCLSDFLEVRDGRFGYSKLIGRFCSHMAPPDIIRSSGQWLWLMFQTDATLNYMGFIAHYEFVLRKRQLNTTTEIDQKYKSWLFQPGYECIITASTSSEELIINRDIINYNQYVYQHIISGRTCTWIIEADKYKRILIWWNRLNFHPKNPKTFRNVNTKQLACLRNHIEIYDGNTMSLSLRHRVCYQNEDLQYLLSNTQKLYIKFKLSHRDIELYRWIGIDFSAYITIISQNGVCSESEFDCNQKFNVIPSSLTNGISKFYCIHKSLLCNHRPNCPNDADERFCREMEYIQTEIAQINDIEAITLHNQVNDTIPLYSNYLSSMNVHKIVLSAIGLLLLLITVISVIVSCRHRMHRSLTKYRAIILIDNEVDGIKLFRNGTQRFEHRLPSYISSGIEATREIIEQRKQLLTEKEKYLKTNNHHHHHHYRESREYQLGQSRQPHENELREFEVNLMRRNHSADNIKRMRLRNKEKNCRKCSTPPTSQILASYPI
ncbi:hypothetical protein SNEBB_011205 [Seison nebaliae]|nr:hypothetical protein SNEBB_011205 [Seison nebaliae]